MTKYEPRDSFSVRLGKMDNETQYFYEELEKEFRKYEDIKVRPSLRCVTFRYNKEVIAKVALGGKTLKLYLAMDPNDKMLNDGKYHPRDLSSVKAYALCPTMLPIKSDLALRKAKVVIQYVVLKKIFNL